MKPFIIIALLAVAVAGVLYLAFRQPEVQEAGRDLKQDVRELGHDAKDGVKDAYDATKDAAQDAKEKVQETVK